MQREQLASHEEKVLRLGDDLAEHKRNPPPSKGLQLQNYIEKDAYLQYEVLCTYSINAKFSFEFHLNDFNFVSFFFQLKRYKTYVNILSAPTSGDQQNNFQNSITDETKLPCLQSNSQNNQKMFLY